MLVKQGFASFYNNDIKLLYLRALCNLVEIERTRKQCLLWFAKFMYSLLESDEDEIVYSALHLLCIIGDYPEGEIILFARETIEASSLIIRAHPFAGKYSTKDFEESAGSRRKLKQPMRADESESGIVEQNTFGYFVTYQVVKTMSKREKNCAQVKYSGTMGY